MKQYDLIVGIGCSFMEGGGLDNPMIHKILNNLESIASEDDRKKFKKENNFIKYLADLFGCEYINLSESRSANDLIFEKIYKYFKENQTNKKILFVGQLSLFTRIYTYYEKINGYVKINNLDFNNPPFNGNDMYKELYQYYDLYLKYIYNENVVYENLLQNLEIYNAWLNNKSIDTIWLSYDGNPKQFKEGKNFIKFDGDNLGAYVSNNKLRLCDIVELNTDDMHMSIEAHKIVAKKIYEWIN